MMKRPTWQTEGKEPDYRFSLANERTFLAWVRTALSILAGGVLLDQFATRIQPRIALVAVAVALALVSAALAYAAYMRWKNNEIAMRHARPLPSSLGIPILSGAIILLALALAALLLLQ